VHYGDLVGVADVSLDVQPGSIVGAARLERRRQDHHAQLHRRPGASSGGTIEWRGRSDRRRAGLCDRIERSSAVAGGLGGCSSRRPWSRTCVSGATVQSDKGKIAALYERVYALFPRLAERRKQLAGHALGRRTPDGRARPRR